MLSLSKLARITIEIHRSLPANAMIEEVTLKKRKTDEWFAILSIEMDTEPPARLPWRILTLMRWSGLKSAF